MSTPNVDAAREQARQANGEFGVQPLAEATDVEMDDRLDFSTIPEVQALGDLTPGQERLLGILLDPKNDSWQRQTSVEESLEDFTYMTGTDTSEDRTVADRLREHYNRELDFGAFEFEHIEDSDGTVSSYNVSTFLGDGLYLSVSDEVRHLGAGRDERTGLAAALHTAEVLDDDFQRLRSRAIAKGLVPDPEAQAGKPDLHAAKSALAALDATGEHDDIDVDTIAELRAQLAAYVAADTAPRKSVWPENDEEHEAFAMWQYEVSNKDTCIDFRSWLEDRDPDPDFDDERDHAETLPGQPGHVPVENIWKRETLEGDAPVQVREWDEASGTWTTRTGR